MTWKDYLFVAFKNTLSSESENAQQHRAELDFEMGNVKEKIEILDQGNFLEINIFNSDLIWQIQLMIIKS